MSVHWPPSAGWGSVATTVLAQYRMWILCHVEDWSLAREHDGARHHEHEAAESAQVALLGHLLEFLAQLWMLVGGVARTPQCCRGARKADGMRRVRRVNVVHCQGGHRGNDHLGANDALLGDAAVLVQSERAGDGARADQGRADALRWDAHGL
eukprot:CAMPEP_0185163300 /NCGR_PEP_ID=MMETSP1139-20130426/7783_1 /TAXON_ID=298111 /ORGANISM="Pavlova sp., Strain CCMP459" /LENGTH=152 /DNA_ID=CAMNT_0027728651 /DNA_START=299 /DNA_END=757 /DNA_ORIENTATION=-